MAIAFDNATRKAVSTASSYTFTHTCSGDNRFLIVSIYAGTDYTTVNGITYNGVSMTFLEKAKYASNTSYVWVFYLINPSSGTYNVVVSLNQSAWGGGVAVSYTGVKQLTPIDAYGAILQNSTTLITKTITTTSSNCWLIGTIVSANINDANLSVGNSLTTKRASLPNDEGARYADSNGEVGTGSITGSFSYTTSNLTGLVLLAIKPATVASNTTNFFQFFN